MAINFPDSPTDGQAYTDSGTGQTWTYELATNSWTASSLAVTGGVVYKGSLDITAAPPTGAKAGEQWSVATAGTANAGYAPGVTGTITKGSMVMYTGTDWLGVSHSIPDATTAVKGIDTQKWNRTGTFLSPANAGDKVGIGTAAPTRALQVYDSSNAIISAKAGSIEGFLNVTPLAFNIESASGSNVPITFSPNGSLKATLDTSGRLLVGTSTSPSAGGGQYSLAVVQGYQGNANGAGDVSIQRGQAAAAMPIGTDLGYIKFNDNAGNTFAHITGLTDTTPSSCNYKGRLALSTRASGASTPTQRMTIDSSGNVGIGTSTPSRTFHVSGTTDTPVQFQTSESNLYINLANSSASNGYIGFEGTTLSLWNGGSSRLNIDKDGRLLVGTSSSAATANGYTPGLQVAAQAGSISATSYRSDELGGVIALQKSRSNTVGTQVAAVNGDECGIFSFEASDGSSFKALAQIRGVIDGGVSANDVPGRLVFSTTADGASAPTQRMTIDSVGNLRLGFATTNGAGGVGYTIEWAGGQPYVISNVSSATRTHQYFQYNGANVGTITTTTTATAYNTSSDYRLKENVTAVTDGITRLQQLKPSRFNFIAEPGKTVDGFLAHEAQAVVPEAVTGKKDAVDADGKPVYQGIDQSKLVPLLTAALQEALTRIEQLEAKVAALEGSPIIADDEGPTKSTTPTTRKR